MPSYMKSMRRFWSDKDGKLLFLVVGGTVRVIPGPLVSQEERCRLGLLARNCAAGATT